MSSPNAARPFFALLTNPSNLSRADDVLERPIGFEDDWLETIVGVLVAEGYPKAARSEIVRVALLGLREALAGRSRSSHRRATKAACGERSVEALSRATRSAGMLPSSPMNRLVARATLVWP
jgi:hypothetical protein